MICTLDTRLQGSELFLSQAAVKLGHRLSHGRQKGRPWSRPKGNSRTRAGSSSQQQPESATVSQPRAARAALDDGGKLPATPENLHKREPTPSAVLSFMTRINSFRRLLTKMGVLSCYFILQLGNRNDSSYGISTVVNNTKTKRLLLQRFAIKPLTVRKAGR